MTSHMRPTGPRNPRSLSPSPYSLPETAPLNIRRSQTPSLDVTDPLSISVSPSIYPVSFPRRRARPVTPRLDIGAAVARNGQGSHRSNDRDSPPSETSVPGRLPPLSIPSTDSGNQITLRPPVNSGPQNARSEPLDDLSTLRQTVSEISNDEIRSSDYTQDEWGDEFFEEIERLGEGAGGAVHKVKDKRTGAIIARKTITTRETPSRQLVRELSYMRNAVHQNICRFYGAYISPSSSEIKVLMELCEGKSLESVGKRIREGGGRVGEKVAGRLAEGIFQGLNYLHSQRIIHRDIKPSNILLTREGIVRLCDFGVSGDLIDSMAATFTGTSCYMAPERINGESYSIRADVWSAGLSLLELVTNKFPFPNDSGVVDLIFYITKCDPPSLEDEEDVKWSDPMKDFIKRTLRVSPVVRPTPGDMLIHPWLVENMKKEVPMARWLAQVWDWPRPPKRRDGYSHVRLSPSNAALTVTTSRPSQTLASELESPRSHRGRLSSKRLPASNGQLKSRTTQASHVVDVYGTHAQAGSATPTAYYYQHRGPGVFRSIELPATG